MPSRKQRRRRQKLQRHEYEYVVETDEGEVPLDRLREADDAEVRGRDGRSTRPATSGLIDRRGRPIEKPTLRRVLRRAAIFGPILAIFVYLTAGDRLDTAGIVVNALVLIAFFIPFSYFVDLMVYRLMLRRYERDHAEKRR